MSCQLPVWIFVHQDQPTIQLRLTNRHETFAAYMPSYNRGFMRHLQHPSSYVTKRRHFLPGLLRINHHHHFGVGSRNGPATHQKGCRTLFTDAVPSMILPPVVFLGLLVGLWTYKCMMTVLFQDKIIYMPYMPPFSRGEKIEDYISSCEPVQWKSRHIRSLDRTKITLCIGQMPREVPDRQMNHSKHIIICYFQGNGSSLPPRLPLLSNVLKSIEANQAKVSSNVHYTLVALSYRGYWTSSGRATQSGIELDAQALLRWINEEYIATNPKIILWGQSIGAGVATTATARYYAEEHTHTPATIIGLVLETPFTSVSSMLHAIYPQKWLPYRYLSPFLWNHWDSERALERIARNKSPPRILLLPAAKDEIVPPSEANKLESICYELGLQTQRKDIEGALHTEATAKRAGQNTVVKFMVDAANSGGDS